MVLSPIIFKNENIEIMNVDPPSGCKHGKVDQESAPLNVNLEMPLESDPY